MDIKKLFKKVLIFGIAVALFSTFISLLAGEFIVKHVMPQETYPLARSVGLHIYDESPIIPYTLQKNVQKFFHISYTREFAHYISTNSKSTRGEDFAAEKPQDTYRILFLGDSMTLGWGVNDDKTYPYLSGQYLNKFLLANSKYKKAEIINAGFTDAKSPDSYYLYYKEIASKYNPDLVIVNVFPYNDISDMFYNSWEKVDDLGYPTKIISKTHKVEDGYLVSRQKSNWKFEFPVLRNWHLGILFLNALERGTPSLVERIKKYEGIVQTREPLSKEEDNKCVYSTDVKDCPSSFFPYLEKTTFILKGINQMVTNQKHDILFTIMASPDQVLPLSEKENKLTLLPKAQPQKYFRDFFEKEKINYFDLLPAQTRKNAKFDFFSQDGHLNEKGHELIAQTIAQFLAQKNPQLFDSKKLNF